MGGIPLRMRISEKVLSEYWAISAALPKETKPSSNSFMASNNFRSYSLIFISGRLTDIPIRSSPNEFVF